MNGKYAFLNRRQGITSKLHYLWGKAVVGQYNRREWEDFQMALEDYFSAVDKLIKDERKTNGDKR